MRKDVRLGLAVGCVLLFAVLIYVLFFTGPAARNAGTVAGGSGAGGLSSHTGSTPTPGVQPGPSTIGNPRSITDATGTGTSTGAVVPGAADTGAGIIKPVLPDPPTTRPVTPGEGSYAGGSAHNDGTGTSHTPIGSGTTFDWQGALTRGMNGSGLGTGAGEIHGDGGTGRTNDVGAGTGTSTTAAREHIVKPGDTLWGIARAEYGNASYVNHIIRANPGIDPGRLKANMKLVIPAKEDVVPVETPGTVMAASAQVDSTTQYRVVSGDNLSTIAKKLYGTTTRAGKLYEANKDLIGPNPNALKLNMVLRLPEPPTVLPSTGTAGNSVPGVSPAVSDLR